MKTGELSATEVSPALPQTPKFSFQAKNFSFWMRRPNSTKWPQMAGMTNPRRKLPSLISHSF